MKIEPAGDLSLTYAAGPVVAFGENGEVVLTDGHHIHLHRHDGSKYKPVGKTPLPDGITKSCYKAISDTTIFVQENTDDPTHQYDSTDLDQLGTLDHKGTLRGVLYPSTLVYSRKRADGDRIIALQQPDDMMILHPPGGRKWGITLSVCRAENFFVVVEYRKKSMDVFTLRGNILLFCCKS